MTLKLNRSIVILDVGHGNSTVVIENGGVVVVDAGPKNALLEFLREQNGHSQQLELAHGRQEVNILILLFLKYHLWMFLPGGIKDDLD